MKIPYIKTPVIIIHYIIIIEYQADMRDVVYNYKYLDTNIIECHVDAVGKKQILFALFCFVLENRRGLNVDSTFMKMLYLCLIKSVMTFPLICWYSLLSIKRVEADCRV